MVVAGYARVSTREQARNSRALEQQIDRLKSAGAEEIYVDIYSGRWHRQNLERLLHDVEAELISKIIVTEASRFGRSTLEGILSARRLIEHEVKFQSLREQIDLEASSGLFNFNLALSQAEGESKRLSERVCDGWDYLRRQQKAINPPFGYEVENDRYVLDHKPFLCLLDTKQEMSQAAIAHELIETFFERRTLRLTIRAINERYGLFPPSYKRRGGRVGRKMLRFHPGGLSNWLISPVLQGHTCYLKKKGSWFTKKTKKVDPQDWIIYRDTHPDQRLLTEAQAAEIKQIRQGNRQTGGFCQPTLKYPLSGLVVCGECRGVCHSVKGSRGKTTPGYNYYYQCARWRHRGCPQKRMVQMPIIEQAVVNSLVGKAEQVARLANQRQTQADPPEILELKSQLRALQAISGSNPAIDTAISELKRQIQTYEVGCHVASQRQTTNQKLLLETFSDINFYRCLPEAEKRRIFHTLVEKITVKNGEIVQIELKV